MPFHAARRHATEVLSSRSFRASLLYAELIGLVAADQRQTEQPIEFRTA
jgi:hypothetical protein